MRFHIGYSFRLKTLLKWVLPIIVGLGAFFGIANIEVLADSVGYYEIDGTTDTQCNIFMGDTTTNNIIHNQVTSNFNYNDTTITLNQVQNGITQGWKSSNILARYKRNNTQTLQFSFKVTNNGFIESCMGGPSGYTADNCYNPIVYIYYCKDSTFDINSSSSCYYESLNNSSNRSILNYTFRTNSWINNYKRTDSSITWDYIQILLPNMSHYSSGVPTLNTGWEYYDVYFGDTSFNETSSMLSNYCAKTGAPNESGNVNSSVTDAVNDAITQSLVGPDGFLSDPTLPNISIPFFDSLLFNPTNIQGILLFPVNMINVVTSNMNTCAPFSIDLSSITRKWGGYDYVLTIPCIRSKIQSLLGDWYTIFDTLIAGILFYYFASNLILKINDTLSGFDAMPYFFSSSSRGRTTRPSLADISRERGHN